MANRLSPEPDRRDNRGCYQQGTVLLGSLFAGSAWTTNPGTSSQPPAGTLPSVMGVVVSTKVGQSGSTISGDVSRIIVVTPNTGYDPNAGHSGTGTVVATYCSTGG